MDKEKKETEQVEVKEDLLAQALNEKNANLEKELAEKDKQLKQFQDFILSSKIENKAREEVVTKESDTSITEVDIQKAYDNSISEMVKIVKNS